MTADGFRKLALRLPEASESAHTGHPDFRVRGRICAEPAVFAPVKGGWGRGGATQVFLEPAKTKSLGLALTLAWRNVAPGGLVKKAAQKPK